MTPDPACPPRLRGGARPANLSILQHMALYIRDFRASDRAGLSGLGARSRLLGRRPAPDAGVRILCGLRGDGLAAAVRMTLSDHTGFIPALQAGEGATRTSDVREMLAEACLWFTARGATQIELSFLPDDGDLISTLREMGFAPCPASRVLRRAVPARSAA